MLTFFIQPSSGQSDSEIRYSFELEDNEKFTWKVDNYLDDGIEVTQQQTYFGRVVNDATITFTVVENPSSVNILTEPDLGYMIDVFKMVVGNTEISLAENIGILQFLIMPTRYTINNTETKNYIHYYFKDVLGGEVNTIGDIFFISVETVDNFSIHSTAVNIESWDLEINRQTGILESMGLIANSDGSNFELNISKAKPKADNERFPVNTQVFLITLILVPLVRKFTSKS